MFMSNKTADIANRVAGEILGIVVNVEGELERFIMYYILGISSNKQNFLGFVEIFTSVVDRASINVILIC